MSLHRAVCVALAVASLAAVGASAALSASPKTYYLALGDSIAYGVQPPKMRPGAKPSDFDSGYADLFWARLRRLAPKIQLVNYSCPGESTTTFVAGGCPWLAEKRPLHDPFRGAQLTAALSFLAAHRGQVSPITLSLGGNDLERVAEICKGDIGCIRGRAPRAFAQFGARLTTILRRLRAAAPKAQIVVTGVWNFNADALKETGSVFRSFETTIGRSATAANARFADTLPLFNPRGTLSHERATVCRLTFACSADDPHPTDAGHRAIAKLVFAVSGY
jgi:lysophospholipase L1-like esterase